nr:glutathione S-transferase N-terminal domain-containing protein [uncultured Roseococcus sp.]
MKLHFSAASPFVRKVSAVALHHGIELDRVVTNPHLSPPHLLVDNPLSKVPALVLDNGMSLPDSPVICEYLDSIGTAAKLYPAAGAPRWEALRLAALADGMLTVSVLRRGLSIQPVEEARTAMIERQKIAVARTLAQLEQETLPATLNIGVIGLVCALGYLDFRFGDDDWRARHPALAAFFAAQSENPIFAQTVPQG